MNQLETHFYDGKIKELYKELVYKQNTTTDFTSIKWNINEVLKEIINNKSRLNLNQEKNNLVNRAIFLIIHERDSNYDPINDIDVLDILCRTWYFVKKLEPNEQIEFYNQLMEINNGSCSQGRSTRLFQIFYTFF